MSIHHRSTEANLISCATYRSYICTVGTLQPPYQQRTYLESHVNNDDFIITLLNNVLHRLALKTYMAVNGVCGWTAVFMLGST